MSPWIPRALCRTNVPEKFHTDFLDDYITAIYAKGDLVSTAIYFDLIDKVSSRKNLSVKAFSWCALQ